MRKRLAVALACSLVIVWSGYAGVDTLAPARDYRSTFYHVSVRLPPDWVESEGGKIGQDLYVAVDASGNSGFLRVLVQDVFTTLQWEKRKPRSRQEVDRKLRSGGEAQYNELLTSFSDGLTDVLKEESQFSGLPAIRLSGVKPDGGRLDMYLLYHNGSAVYLLAGTAAGAEPAEADAIRQSLASIVVYRQYEKVDPSAFARSLPVVAGSSVVVVAVAIAATVAWLSSRRRRRRVPLQPDARPTLMEDAGLPPDLPLATTMQRIGNLLLDQVAFLLITVALYSVFMLVAGRTAVLAGVGDPSEDVSGGVYAIIALGGFIGYYTIGEGGFGKTVGKLLTGTEVVNRNGTPLTLWRALARTCCRCVPLDQFSFFGGDRPVGWHDRWTGTFVVAAPKRASETPERRADEGITQI
jgi:uncharacterized RDD family membrane protein YckC